MPSTILLISASPRASKSVTRQLTSEVLDQLHDPTATVIHRDLSEPIPLLSSAVTEELPWVKQHRSPATESDLAFADKLIEELVAADLMIIGAPIYNFAVPACLKAWADLVARADTTFRFANGESEGLLTDRPTFIVSASGGTTIGGPEDFGTRWLQHFLGFLGITDVSVLGADSLNGNATAALAKAHNQIRSIGRPD